MSEPLIRWRKEYELGIADVDHEHRELVELINDTYADATRPDAATSFGEMLGEILARISAHFALEERIMRECRYDGYEEHKADHERLLDEIRDRMDEYDDGRVPDLNVFAAGLEDWFGGHFGSHDARLHHHLG